MALFGPGSREGGDEGAAERAAGHELEEDVGNAEGCEVDVQIGRSSEAGADDDLTQKARASAEEEKKHDEGSCARDCFAVERPHAIAAGLGVTTVRFRHVSA